MPRCAAAIGVLHTQPVCIAHLFAKCSLINAVSGFHIFHIGFFVGEGGKHLEMFPHRGGGGGASGMHAKQKSYPLRYTKLVLTI